MANEWLAYSSRSLDELMARRLAEKMAAQKHALEEREVGMREAQIRDTAAQRDRQHAETMERMERAERQQQNLIGLQEMRLQAGEDYTLSPGQRRVRDGQTIAEGAPRPETDTASQKDYTLAQQQGYKGSFMDYQREVAQGQQRPPYFTGQAAFDPQGRPVGGMRFNTRTGEWSHESFAGGPQLKPPPGQLPQMAVMGEASQGALDNLQKLFDAGAKDLIGPASGRLYSTGQKIPGVPVNQTFADFEAATAAFRNATIKAITGAQMSEPEARRIRQQIPEVADKPEVWRAKAAQTRLNLQILNERIAGKTTGGGEVPAGPARKRYNPATGQVE